MRNVFSPRSLSVTNSIVWMFGSLFLCGLVSCSGTTSQARNLPLVVEEFNQALRWGNLNVALGCVDPAVAPEVGRHLRGVMSSVQVMDAEILSVEMDKTGKRALVLVQFSWTESGAIHVRQGVEIQVWDLGKAGWKVSRQLVPDSRDGRPSPFARHDP